MPFNLSFGHTPLYGCRRDGIQSNSQKSASEMQDRSRNSSGRVRGQGSGVMGWDAECKWELSVWVARCYIHWWRVNLGLWEHILCKLSFNGVSWSHGVSVHAHQGALWRNTSICHLCQWLSVSSGTNVLDPTESRTWKRCCIIWYCVPLPLYRYIHRNELVMTDGRQLKSNSEWLSFGCLLSFLCVVLKIQPRAGHMWGKATTTEPWPKTFRIL